MRDILLPSPVTVRQAAADRWLGTLPILLLVAVLVALWRGRAHWAEVPWPVWVHLGTMLPALALTPWILFQPKGDRDHRVVGYLWLGLLVATALISFDIRLSRHGGLSIIHIISAWVLFQSWRIVSAARQHRPAVHRRRVRGMVIGALLIAGFFTFPFGRMLGTWLLG